MNQETQGTHGLLSPLKQTTSALPKQTRSNANCRQCWPSESMPLRPTDLGPLNLWKPLERQPCHAQAQEWQPCCGWALWHGAWGLLPLPKMLKGRIFPCMLNILALTKSLTLIINTDKDAWSVQLDSCLVNCSVMNYKGWDHKKIKDKPDQEPQTNPHHEIHTIQSTNSQNNKNLYMTITGN